MFGTLARWAGALLTTVAKTIGALSGAKPFTDAHAAEQRPPRDDYRP